MNQRLLRLLIPAICFVGLVISGVFLIPDTTKDLVWDQDFQFVRTDDTVLQAAIPLDNWKDSLLNPSTFSNPSRRNSPWLVWYWPGTDVNLPQTIKELTWIADQGFGGVEIQVTGKGIPVAERQGQFRDPKWIFLLQQVSHTAQQFGLEIDWVFGPGIPAVISRGQQGLTWGESHIRGDQETSFLLPQPNTPVGHRLSTILNRDETQDNTWSQWHPDSSRLLGVWAGKPRSDQRSAAFWSTTDFIQLDPDSTWSLSEWVRGDSIVKWPAPKGPWKVIAVYETDLSVSPYHSLTSFRETVIDPYSPIDLQKGLSSHPAFLAYPQDSFAGRAIRARFQLPVADRLIPETTQGIPGVDSFEKSLFPLLLSKPLAHHAGATRLQINRQSEYSLSEVDQSFEQHYEDWLVTQQLPTAIKAMNQTIQTRGYASKLVVNDWDRGWFDMASSIDIPAFDSHISDGHRLAASLVCDGAYFGGKSHITAYVGEVPDMAYSNTPQLLKAQIDRAIFTGATEIAVHGKPYRHYTGQVEWDPATTHDLLEVNHGGQYDQANPFHRWWPKLWKYTSRIQYLSQLGTQQTDVLVLFPFAEFPTSTVDSIFSLVEPPVRDDLHWNRLSTLSRRLLERQTDSLALWLNSVKPFLQSLEDNGYSWSWMSETGIVQLAGGIRSIDSLYPGLKAFLIPEGGSVRLATAEAINRLHTDSHLEVYLLGKKRPAARELYKPDSSNMMVTHLFRSFELPFPISTGPQLIQWLNSADLRPDLAFTNPSTSIRQRSQLLPDGSRILWLMNAGDQPGSVSIVFGNKTGWLLDPETGFASEFTPDPTGVSSLSLSQYETKIIWLGNMLTWPDSLIQDVSPSQIPWLEQLEGATFEPLNSWEWAIDYPKESPEILVLPDTGLWDWREDELLQFYQGEVSYTIDLKLNSAELESVIILDLGSVYDAVELQVNTHSLPLIAWAPYRYQISDYLHPGLNTVQIWVTNTRRNKKIGDRIDGKENMNWNRGREEDLTQSGMLGPVQLWRIPRVGQRANLGM